MSIIEHGPGFFTIGPVNASGHTNAEGQLLVGSGTVTLAFEAPDAVSNLEPATVLEAVKRHLRNHPATTHIQLAIGALCGESAPQRRTRRKTEAAILTEEAA